MAPVPVDAGYHAEAGRPRRRAHVSKRQHVTALYVVDFDRLRLARGQRRERAHAECRASVEGLVGIGNRLIEPALAAPANDVNGVVRRRERLGGLLSFYHREAA